MQKACWKSAWRYKSIGKARIIGSMYLGHTPRSKSAAIARTRLKASMLGISPVTMMMDDEKDEKGAESVFVLRA